MSSYTNLSSALEGDLEKQRAWTSKDALDRYLSRGDNHPLAVAIWWTHCTVAVRCPYCQRIHKHGCVLPSHHDLTSRASHCGGQPAMYLDYTLIFPFSEHPKAAELGLCFEIDKVKKRFRTNGFETEEPGRSEIDSLAAAFGAASLSDNRGEDDDKDCDDEYELRGDEEQEQEWKRNFLDQDADATDFVSFCVSNNLLRAQKVYQQSLQQSRLLYEQNSAGDTVLCMTSMDGHDEVVDYLLRQGSKPDTVNAKGRTPLMEAALWGHSAVVKLLLDARASTELRDCNGRTALDLAQEYRRNEDERASRSRLYSDDRDKRQRRLIIVALLGGSLLQPKVPSGINIGRTSSARIYRSGVNGISSSIALLTPAVEVPVEKFSKTVALLDRGRLFPIVYAKSGWSTITSEPDFLDNSHWTNEVIQLCESIGYKLTNHYLDGDQPGRFNACHVEKQLMAFFAYKHRFTRKEIDEDENLLELSHVHSPRRLSRATILVSTPMCNDCEAFRALFQHHAEASIDIKYIPTVT